MSARVALAGWLMTSRNVSARELRERVIASARTCRETDERYEGWRGVHAYAMAASRGSWIELERVAKQLRHLADEGVVEHRIIYGADAWRWAGPS